MYVCGAGTVQAVEILLRYSIYRLPPEEGVRAYNTRDSHLWSTYVTTTTVAPTCKLCSRETDSEHIETSFCLFIQFIFVASHIVRSGGAVSVLYLFFVIP